MSPIYLVLATAIGLLIGLLVGNLTSRNESKSAPESKLPKDISQEGFAEVARLWYSPSGKRIVTEMDGEFYKDFLVLSPDQKKRILRLSDLLGKWASKEGAPQVLPGPASTPAILPETSDAIPTTIQPAAAFVYDTPVTDEELVAEIAEEKPLKPKTVAGQISEILDELVQYSPLKEKGIKLIENDHQGVDVWVGLEKFDGIDAIPYPEVQQIIRKAVEQWEREAELKMRFAGKK